MSLEEETKLLTEDAEELCPVCGSVMVVEDGKLVCPHCDAEIDYFGDDEESDK